MNLHLGSQIGFATLVLASLTTPLQAEPPVRPRGNPIIFSAPSTSSTVSSNLSELRTPASPFRNIEAELKKPFEAFDPVPGNNANPLSRDFKPPQPPELNKRSLKDQMNDRAEQMFLSPELFEGEPDPYGLKEETFDPYQAKPRTALDRYYDRLDRNRLAVTNRTTSNDPLTDLKPLGRSDDFGMPGESGIGLSADQNAAMRNLRLMSNNSPASDGYFSDQAMKPANPGNPFGERPSEPFGRKQSPQEVRLEEFKRLLEGPNYKAHAGSAVPTPSYYDKTKPSPAVNIPAYTWSSTPKPGANTAPANDFAKSAGLVGAPGAPQGLPEYKPAASLTPAIQPPPQQPKPLPAPTFKVPQRRL